jgi:hypothetical protein
MKKLNIIIILLTFPGLSSVAFCADMVDPTKPPDAYLKKEETVVKTTTGTLVLHAIFTYSGRTVAIINEQAVSMGDQIGDFSVTSIHGNTVELLGKDGKSLTLELTPEVKQPQKAG